MISKERRSGVYHLSAYYLAKTVSELPLVLVQPSIYLVISYWIVGLNGAAGFFGTWLVLITNSLVAQVYIVYTADIAVLCCRDHRIIIRIVGTWISPGSGVHGL